MDDLLVRIQDVSCGDLHQRGVALSAVRRFLSGACVALSVLGCVTTPVPDGAAVGPVGTLDPDSPYRQTREEWAIRLKACLESKGLTVELDPYDQSLLFTFGEPGAQQVAMTGVAECNAEIDPARAQAALVPSEEQLRGLYAYYVAQSACIVDAGYPASSPPPEQVFLDSEGFWHPLEGVEDTDIPETVVRRCEQLDSRPAFLDW